MKDTFKNFIVNDSNKEAYQLAYDVAKDKQDNTKIYVLCANPGMGKTHLLYSIWSEYLNVENKHSSVISSFGFKKMCESTNGLSEYMSTYKDSSLWLVDDFDKPLNKDNADEISKGINNLINNGTKVFIAVTDMENLNLLSSDLLKEAKFVLITKPSKDEQKAFYKKMCQTTYFEPYDDEAYEYLCSLSNNYQDMKANVLKIQLHCVIKNIRYCGLSKEYLQDEVFNTNVEFNK